MAYTPLQVSIPEPCHEDWDRMTPVNKNRRHCGSCAKHVTDFSWMTDREIHQYLAVAGNDLCGRFRPDQLERPIRAYVKPATGWRSLAAAGGLLLSAGISAQTPAPAPDTTPTVGFVTMTVAPDPRSAHAEPVTGPFRGRVTDENGEPLIGASVSILGTTSGTVTDLDGNFFLTATAGQRIQLSYLGYEPLEFSVVNDDPGFGEVGAAHVLFAQAENIEEIVVVGLEGVMGKMALGGAVIVTQEPACISSAGFRSSDPADCSPNAEADRYISYPNPFTNQLNVQFQGADAGAISAQLFNVNGQLLRIWPARLHEAGEVSMAFPTGDLDLTPGHYVLRLTDEAGEPHSVVVIHQ